MPKVTLYSILIMYGSFGFKVMHIDIYSSLCYNKALKKSLVSMLSQSKINMNFLIIERNLNRKVTYGFYACKDGCQ